MLLKDGFCDIELEIIEAFLESDPRIQWGGTFTTSMKYFLIDFANCKSGDLLLTRRSERRYAERGVRSVSNDDVSLTYVIGSGTKNKTVTIKDFIKVWSDGNGKTVLDIKSLK